VQLKRDTRSVDCFCASHLAQNIVSKDIGEVLTIARTNPALAREWLAELTAARAAYLRETDKLAEAIEDIEAALMEAAPNVIRLPVR
jgi:hypothetical protein